MKFHEVSKAMDEGKKIKLKDRDNAYWYKKKKAVSLSTMTKKVLNVIQEKSSHLI